MRLFLALELPADAQSRIYEAVAPLRKGFPEIRWIEPQNYHLTLKFLGEVSEERVGIVQEALDQVAATAGVKPFSLEVAGLGIFPAMRRPRILWAGISSGAREAVRFAGLLDDALEPAGFEREGRDFSAHVTLGRFKDPGRPPRGLEENLGLFEKTSFAAVFVNMISLMRSVMKPAGAEYSRLSAIKFGSDRNNNA